MTTKSAFVEKLRRALGDNSDYYDDDLISDAITEAHKAILPYQPKPAVETLTATSDGYITLPSDFYAVDGVLDCSTDNVIPRTRIAPGVYIGTDVGGNSWQVYPHGYISFANPPDSGDTFTLYYRAYWTAPSDDDDEFEVGAALETPIIYWCAAYLLLPEAIGAAELRQYNKRSASGNPEHNPVAERVDLFMKLFRVHLSKMEPYRLGEEI